MKKWLLSLCIILALSACKDEKKQTAQVTNKPVIKIGIIAPLTGNVAMVGEGIKSSVTLAEEDLKTKNLKNKYEFVIEDDGYEARKTAAVYPKLKSLDKVDAILSTFSQTGKIIAPRAEADKILHISLSSDAEIANGKYNFLDWTMPKYTSGRMVEFYKKHGFKNIVAIIPNNDGTLSVEEKFMEWINQNKDMHVTRFLVSPTETDFRTILAKAAQKKADVYLAMVYGNIAASFFKQYKESGETAPITSIETFATLSDPSIAEGAYYTDAAVANDDFMERHQQRFGQISRYGVGTMYDMIMLTVEAFENAKDKSSAVDELAKIKQYNGVVGTLTQDDEGIFNSEAVLMKIENGKVIKVEE